MAISLTTLTLLGQRKGNLMIPVRHILWIAAVSIAACSCDDSPASVVGIDDAGVGGAGGFFGSSQGGASKGQGGSNASQGGSNASLGGSNASQGGFSASQGGSDASQGGFNASLGGSDASQGGSSADQGGSNAFTGGTDAGPTLFAINGTVVGLEGTGFVLQNNAGDNLAVSKNGAFTFATLIDSGAAYSVSVMTQPSNPAQTCTVSNGAGTVSNADVSNVMVNCTTNTFTIGGTATGLAGTGLVLQNNAGDDLTVSANGTFTFLTPVKPGVAYSASIKTQPSNPTQTCTLSGGTGTVGNANVSSITVNCNTSTHTIGGTATGLAGKGLVLQNNAGDDLNISANGTFAFATPMVSDVAYNVSIKTQPSQPTQTCLVTSGTGTMGNANVTSVSVTCSTNVYPIGGLVSGLTGSGLKLQINLASDLPISENGAFQFTDPMTSGATYSVTVLAQPVNPLQTCVVTNGVGTIGADVVSAVLVTCTTNTYSVGGTLTGLVGTGLVLQNNAGDDLPLGSNGAFNFAGPIASGSAFNVTVKTQPTWQTCTVTAGSGTVSNANVASVGVACSMSSGRCASDGDCAGGWCLLTAHSCTSKLDNGAALPSDASHTSPTLDGTCTAQAAALVCTTGVCDSDNLCGWANGDGSCTTSAIDARCRSGQCSANGTCAVAGGCNVDGDCVANHFCMQSTHACTAKLTNGLALPNDPGHTNPTLNGTCSAQAATLVCSSGVCDTDNACGWANGGGSCNTANADTRCRSGVCSTNGTCEVAGGCNVDADCSGGQWCLINSHACTAKLTNGNALPSDAAHSNPTLNGTCSAQAAALVCSSGVCDTDNACGWGNGDGTCNTGADSRCRSGICSASATCQVVGGCNVDADCGSGLWCLINSHACTAKVTNGATLPVDPSHANPTLNGVCSMPAAALVCATGVCDTDNACGWADGDGTCSSATADGRCRSGLCSTNGTCQVASGCNVDADCAGGQWCQMSAHTCAAKVSNGAPIPTDAAHVNPALNGTCSAQAGTLVCSSGVCDADNACGWADGDGSCNASTADSRCRSGACSAGGTCVVAGGCNLDSDCSGGEWCLMSTHACTAKLANGTAVPSDPRHSNPTLSGACTAQAAALVCSSSVCDTDNACGWANGGGSCNTASADARCRSGACSADGTCRPAGGCNLDADCGGGQWCTMSTHTCNAQLSNGTVLPSDPGHTTPTLNGACSAQAATLVCSSGVCDTDNKCGWGDGDGTCTPSSADSRCRSGVCSANSTCLPLGGCNVDADCGGGHWCEVSNHTCNATVSNGNPLPSDPGHTNPTLDGTCTAQAGALVCTSGVCDPADNACGWSDGSGSCNAAGPDSRCRSGECSVDGTCEYAAGCNVDADCSSSQWCTMSSHTCTAKVADGLALPSDPSHTNPTLNGTCTAQAATVVCTSGVCDTDNKCGLISTGILKYTFEDGTGTTVTDVSGHDNNGLLQNVTWATSGRNTMGASFADPASAVALPNNVLANANALTVSAWVNLTANATNTRLFDFGTDDATNSLYLALDNGSGGMSLVATVGGGTSKTMSIDSRLPTAVWKHVAVTLSSAGAYLYIDGKPVAHDATFQVTPSALGATTSNWIGQSLAGTGPALAGAVDEFYMFRAALSIAQIRTLAAPKTDYSIYHFDEGSGTTAADSSDRTNSLSQALTGTLQGGATWVASPFGTGVMLTNSPSTAPAVQYVALANGSLAGCTTRATFSAWINPTTNTTIAPVLEFGYDSTHYTNVTTYVGGSSPGSAASFYFINGTGSSFVVTQKLTYPSGWTHIAVVRGDDPVNGAGRDAAVYVNGALQTSTTNTKRGAAFWDATASTTTSNFIGKSQVATTPGFNGAIDEVLVSCRPYTADEIKQLAYLPAP